MAKKMKAMKAPKAGAMAKVEHVRVSRDKPNATVKFKVTKADKEGNMTVRATARGETPIFVKGANGAWKAGVRGDSPVAGKTPDQAWAKAAKRYWA
jgi:hypothetical protein